MVMFLVTDHEGKHHLHKEFNGAYGCLEDFKNRFEHGLPSIEEVEKEMEEKMGDKETCLLEWGSTTCLFSGITLEVLPVN